MSTGPVNPRNCANLVATVMQKCRTELGAADANIAAWLKELGLRDEATASLVNSIDTDKVQAIANSDFDAIRRVHVAATAVLEMVDHFEQTCNVQQEGMDDTSREDDTDFQFDAANAAAEGVANAVAQLNAYAARSSLTEVGPIARVRLDKSTGGRTPVIDLVADNLSQWLAYSSAQGRGGLIDHMHIVHEACLEFRRQCAPFRQLQKRIRADRAEAKAFIEQCAKIESDLEGLLAEYRTALEAAR